MAAPPRFTRDASLGKDRLLRTEWLLTNGLGGFAMGTALGPATRRYHALLIAAARPPVGRIAALSAVVEHVILHPGTEREETFDLSSFRFTDGCEHPRGFEHLIRFEKEPARCRWVFGVAGTEVVRTLELVRGQNTARLRYDIRAREPSRLDLRPLVALRDFHGLLATWHAEGQTSVTHGPGHVDVSLWGHTLRLSGLRFRRDEQWWHNFEYQLERERGLEFREDLFSPGVFSTEPGRPEPVVLSASLIEPTVSPRLAAAVSVAPPAPALREPKRPLIPEATRRALRASVEDYLVRRFDGEGLSVIAGFPWFSDWGRDAMICLPGLLLATGRHAEARSLLHTFARQVRRGLLPNTFDDGSGGAHYNTVDAPLWFLHAACEYVRISGDRAGFAGVIGRGCLEIISFYEHGTDFGIGMDPADGLIRAGDHTTQLTWMDAKRDGVVFTPRHGKAVEINALWRRGLMGIGRLIHDDAPYLGRRLLALAERVGESMGAFWDPKRRCLFDVLPAGEAPPGADRRAGPLPHGKVRPNQIFAVSLPHSALADEQRRAVVECVRARLLTPHGLRTLDPEDPDYAARFRGGMMERDRAYHNGTVWPWLLGPFAEAVMRLEAFSAASRAEAISLVRPLLDRLDGECPGHLPEVFDADDSPEHPQRPGGCPAQAWSLAEVIRIVALAEETMAPEEKEA